MVITKPSLTARFETDPAGQLIRYDDGSRRKYKVAFEISDMPAETYAAVVELDPESYDPFRTLTAVPGGVIRFDGVVTRDHDITVRFMTPKGEVPMTARLSTLLGKLNPADDSSPARDEALTYLRSEA